MARRSFAAASLLAVALLLLAFRGADWRELLEIVQRAHVEYLALGAAIVAVSLFVRAARWGVLLGRSGLSPLGSVFSATVVGYLANGYLPARAGEVIRCVMVARTGNVSTSFALATTLTERLLDAATLALIGSAMLISLPGLPTWLSSAAGIAGILALVGTGGLVVLPHFDGLIKKLMPLLPLSGNLRERAAAATEQFLLGMKSFQRRDRALAFAGLTGAIWLVDGLGSVVGAWALDLPLSLQQGLVLLAALGLASALPSTPGFVGIYQFVAVTVLVPFGYSQSEALAYILVSQVVYYAVLTGLGVIGIWRLGTAKLSIPVESVNSVPLSGPSARK